MRLKYYLRGLGVGIIVTTIILAISFSGREVNITDDEIIARAKQLGMVMPEEDAAGGEDTGAEDGEDPPADGADAGGSKDVTDAASMSQPLPGDPAADTDDPGSLPDGAGGGEPEIYRLTIRRGDVCRVVCENLAANGVVSDAEALREYLLQIGYASHISVGEYDIPYGLTNEEVAEILKAGPLEEEE